MPPRAMLIERERTIASGSARPVLLGFQTERPCNPRAWLAGPFLQAIAAVLVEQEDEVDGLGELGPARVLRVETEAAILRVELLGQRSAAWSRPVLDSRAGPCGVATDLPSFRRTISVRPSAARSISPRSSRQDLSMPISTVRNPAKPLAVAGREVRFPVEGPAVGQEEHRHRPPSRAERLECGHVDLIDVGSLLAIDLDAHEMLIQELGDLGIHEALALHDVAPVARAVADREEDRLLLGLGPGERLGPPGIPVHRDCGRGAAGRGWSPAPADWPDGIFPRVFLGDQRGRRQE